MDYKAIILSLFFTLSIFYAFAAEKTDTIDRVPKIHGVLRTRYEGEWQTAEKDGDSEGTSGTEYQQRFQVRNVRVSLEGQLLKPLDWYMRVDLCDRGKMKFLDAWMRWRFTPEWGAKMGQFRVPFGVDAFRAPGTYIFANRSFIGKQMANVRQVGLQFGYYGRRVPLTVEAGVFNSAPMADHDVWQKGMDYAAKAIITLPTNVSLSAGFLSMMPYGVRMNLVDAAIGWNISHLQLGAEYQHLHYIQNGISAPEHFPDVNAWLVWGNWAQPVDWGYFDRWNINARFDSMTNHSNGKPSTDGLLPCDDPERRRLTVGTSLSCNVSKVKFEIFLNYEKYFYPTPIVAPAGSADKLLLELVAKF